MNTKTLIGKIDATDMELDLLIETSSTRLLRAIDLLEQNIMAEVKNLSVGAGGTLMGPRINLVQAQKIHKEIILLFAKYFGTEAYSVSQDMGRVMNIIQNNWPEVTDAAFFTSVDESIIFSLETQAHRELMAFADTAQERMTQAMYDTIISRSPYSVLVSTVHDILKGGTDARGMSMTRYANMWANDTVMNFHQWVSLKKANDADLTYFLYYGNIMKTSRRFCIEHAGGVYSKEEILSWNNLSWAGKSGPPLTHRGGYNCRHHWTPVKKEWIPEGKIEVQNYFNEQK